LNFAQQNSFGRAPHFVRVGLSAPSPSGCTSFALRWFRYYPSRCQRRKDNPNNKFKPTILNLIAATNFYDNIYPRCIR
jgi:hypothetical protein